MVHPSSLRIPRVRRYFGFCLLTSRFAYVILTLFDAPSHVLRLRSMIRVAVLNPSYIATAGLASSTFARHYSRNLVWFLFLRVLRCFSSPGSPHIPIDSVCNPRFFIVCVPTFGNLRIKAYMQLPAAYRSLSSFFGSQCQGILHMLLFAWTTFLRCSASYSLAVLAVLFFAFRIAMIILHFTVNSFLFASKNCFLPANIALALLLALFGKTWFLQIIFFPLLCLSCVLSLIRFSMNIGFFQPFSEHACMFLCQALQLHKLSLVSL